MSNADAGTEAKKRATKSDLFAWLDAVCGASETGNVVTRSEAMASHLGVSRATANRWLNELKDSGLVSVEPMGRKGSRVWLPSQANVTSRSAASRRRTKASGATELMIGHGSAESVDPGRSGGESADAAVKAEEKDLSEMTKPTDRQTPEGSQSDPKDETGNNVVLFPSASSGSESVGDGASTEPPLPERTAADVVDDGKKSSAPPERTNDHPPSLTARRETDRNLPAPLAPERPRETDEHWTEDPHEPPRPIAVRLLLALICIGVAVVVGYYAYETALRTIDITKSFGEELGGDKLSDERWGALGEVSDVFKVLGLAVASFLWRLRKWGEAAFIFVAWLIALSYGLNGAAGFASRNMADSAAASTDIARQRAELERDIGRKRAIIDGYGDQTAAAIKGALAAAEQAVPRQVWKDTNGCNPPDVTAESSRRACQSVAALRSKLPRAEEIEVLESEVAALRGKLNALAARGGPEVHFETVASLLNAVMFWRQNAEDDKGGLNADHMKKVTVVQIALQSELPAAAAVMLAVTFLTLAWESVFPPPQRHQRRSMRHARWRLIIPFMRRPEDRISARR